MQPSSFWRELEQRFKAAGAKFGVALAARWIGIESNPDEQPIDSCISLDINGWTVTDCQGLAAAQNTAGERYWLPWTGNAHEHKTFAWLAERAAVGLGHPGGPTAMFFWLDRLKTESAYFHDNTLLMHHDDELRAVSTRAGGIKHLFEASAEYCMKLETECLARESSSGPTIDENTAIDAITSTRSELPSSQDNSVDGRQQVERFIQKCRATDPRISRKHIWQAVGHKQPKQFQRWQRGDDKTTAADKRNFSRILSMAPSKFIELLKSMKILS
jgi:hypothetical protein